MDKYPFNEYKSLAELDPETWQEALENDEELAMLAKRLLGKPVRRLEEGELLPLLRRGVSLHILAPLALAKLEDDPFLRAERHPGDLLVALMEANPTFWKQQKSLWLDAMLLLGDAAARVEQTREAQELGDYYPEFVGEDFMAALLHFRGLHGSTGEVTGSG